MTRGKEPIGCYKNGGSDYWPEGCPDQVNVHDFVDKELGKVVPYGVYDIAANAGCVSVVSITTPHSSQLIRSGAGWM